MAFFLLILMVTGGNFLLGFGLAVWLGHGPQEYLPLLKNPVGALLGLLRRSPTAVAAAGGHESHGASSEHVPAAAKPAAAHH